MAYPSAQDIANIFAFFKASDKSGGSAFVTALSKVSANEIFVAAGTSAAASFNSSAIDTIGYQYLSVQINATSLSAADGIVKLQDSNDGTNWTDITGATLTLAAGSSPNMIRDTANTGRYIRAVWTFGTNASGTLQMIYCLK
jgi:hypothetical protein